MVNNIPQFFCRQFCSFDNGYTVGIFKQVFQMDRMNPFTNIRYLFIADMQRLCVTLSSAAKALSSQSTYHT